MPGREGAVRYGARKITDEVRERIWTLNGRGYTLSSIAKLTGVSLSSVHRILHENDPVEKERARTTNRVQRPCMSCQRPFPSEGIHNRLCLTCKGNSSASMEDYNIAV